MTVERFNFLAERNGIEFATEKAKLYLASVALGRDFGETYEEYLKRTNQNEKVGEIEKLIRGQLC